MKASLPKLPPDVESVVLTAADEIANAFKAAGLPLLGEHGEPSQYLYTVLYLVKDRCIEAAGSGYYVGDNSPIPLAEIAAALETLGRVMVSDGVSELAGCNASFYLDAAEMVSKAERDLKRQLATIDRLLEKGLEK